MLWKCCTQYASKFGKHSSGHRTGWVLRVWPQGNLGAEELMLLNPVVLEKILESPSDCKEITLVNPKGSKSWIFIGRTDAEATILWPPDAKSQLFVPTWTSGSSHVMTLLKSNLENFEYYFASVWDEYSCTVIWTFFGILTFLDLEWKLTFSSRVATAEFFKFAGILSAALWQHHLLGFEIAQLEFHHLY